MLNEPLDGEAPDKVSTADAEDEGAAFLAAMQQHQKHKTGAP